MIQISLRKSLVGCIWICAFSATVLFGNVMHSHPFQWNETDNCISCVLNLSQHAVASFNAQENCQNRATYDIFDGLYHSRYFRVFLIGTDNPRAPPA